MTKVKDNTDNDLKLLAKDVDYIRKAVDKIDERLEKDYVTLSEFDPVKKIVYGLVTLILVAFVGGVIALVLK